MVILQRVRFDSSESLADPLHHRYHHFDRLGLPLLQAGHLPRRSLYFSSLGLLRASYDRWDCHLRDSHAAYLQGGSGPGEGMGHGHAQVSSQLPPEGVNLLFYIHLFFVSLLIAYFPLSKLMHMPGIFLSPTKNLRNTSRNNRHINPWNHPVKVHTYEEYEDEFREPMKEVGLPVEKE